MDLGPNFSNPTGKRNALASFKYWLKTVVPATGLDDFTYSFVSDVSNPKVFSNVGVSELPYFQPGVTSFGMEVFPKNNFPAGAATSQGTLSVMLLQIDIKTDQPVGRDGLQKLYRIRDRIATALRYAGMTRPDPPFEVIVPGIEVRDFRQGGDGESTGVYARIPLNQDTAIQEQPAPPDETTPNLNTLRLLVLLEWFELN